MPQVISDIKTGFNFACGQITLHLRIAQQNLLKIAVEGARGEGVFLDDVIGLGPGQAFLHQGQQHALGIDESMGPAQIQHHVLGINTEPFGHLDKKIKDVIQDDR